MIKAKLLGQWSKARTILNNRPQVLAAMDYAVMAEAQHARRAIVKGITAQAPAGKPFLPHAPSTIAARRLRGFRGTKILIVSAALRNSITVTRTGPGMAFVGVLRTARSPTGKSLFNVARVHEEGATMVIRVTPRMRRFLRTLAGRMGLRGQYRLEGAKLISGVPKLVVVVKVPARPYMRPVLEEIAREPTALRMRLAHRVANRLKLTLGKP